MQYVAMNPRRFVDVVSERTISFAANKAGQ
jgi:hypothetical protein